MMPELARASEPHYPMMPELARASEPHSPHYVVQGLEHRDRHHHRGGDQREHQQREAHRAMLVRLLDVPLPRAHLGATGEPLPPLSVLLDLLDERLFDLREALLHPHGGHLMTRSA